MRFRNRLLLLTIVLTLEVAYAAAAPAPQTGQDIRITNGPVIEEATSNAAVVAWSTDVPSSSRVWYGTDKNNLTHLGESPESGSKTHRVRIANLKPSTTYYFQVESSQRSGNRGEAESAGVRSFKTTAPGAQPLRNQNVQLVENDRAAGAVEGGKVKITNGPVIEEADDNHAQIAWSTNIKGSSRVTYGTEPANLNQLAQSPWGAGGLTHRVQLKNLKPGTTYFFQVETGQAEGSEVESRVFSFRTPNAGEAALRQHQPQQVR